MKNRHFILFVLAAGLTYIVTVSAEVRAQGQSTAASDTVATQKSSPAVDSTDNVKIFLDKIEILGRIEKPQTVFIIPGKDATINDIQIDRSFFREIFRSVEKDDFRKRVENAKQK